MIDFGSDKMLCKMKCCHAWLIKSAEKEGGANLLHSPKRQKQAEICCKSFVTSDSQVLQLQDLDTFKEINASCCEFLLIAMLNVHSFKEAAECSGFCSENINLRKLMKSFKGFAVDF